jgi:hypothetical protein
MHGEPHCKALPCSIEPGLHWVLWRGLVAALRRQEHRGGRERERERVSTKREKEDRPREQQLQLTACSWNSTHSLERGLYLTPT